MVSRMEFSCKLGHSDEVKKVSDFSSIKELYQKVSQKFSIKIDDILFCTLNTHDFRDMNSLLSNYLSLGDLIVVHIRGQGKDLTIEKTQRYLGLTITDNGHGKAFVKKVDSDQELIRKFIRPGDHIASLNSESTIGWRHYEVAKALRDLPQNSKFELRLVEPLHSEDYLFKTNKIYGEALATDFLDDRPSISLVDIKENRGNSSRDSGRTTSGHDMISSQSINPASPYSSFEDLTKSSLPIERLLSKSANANACISEDSNTSDYRRTIDRINGVLETFVGINDNALAIQIYRLARDNKDSFDRFNNAMGESELANFKFDRAIEFNLWNAAISSK